MNTVVSSEVLILGPVVAGSRAQSGPPKFPAPSRPHLMPTESAFAADIMRPPFWHSAGLAVTAELLLIGLGVWVMTGQMPRTATPSPVTSVKLITHHRIPPRPVVEPPPPVDPAETLAPAPVLPRLMPLTPVTGGLAVPRALLLPHPPVSRSAPAQTVVNPLALYAAILREQIRAALVIPSIARQMGLRGKTLVEFRLQPDGRMLWARVVHSSGFSILDHAALAAVRGADFPPFEPRMSRADTTFVLWVHLNVSA